MHQASRCRALDDLRLGNDRLKIQALVLFGDTGPLESLDGDFRTSDDTTVITPVRHFSIPFCLAVSWGEAGTIRIKVLNKKPARLPPDENSVIYLRGQVKRNTISS